MGMLVSLNLAGSSKAAPVLRGIADYFKSGVVGDASDVPPLDIWDFIITLGIAFLIGIFIYIIYRVTFGGVVFEKNFGTSLVMLSMVTAMVILPISTNLPAFSGYGRSTVDSPFQDGGERAERYYIYVLGYCCGHHARGKALCRGGDCFSTDRTVS